MKRERAATVLWLLEVSFVFVLVNSLKIFARRRQHYNWDRGEEVNSSGFFYVVAQSVALCADHTKWYTVREQRAVHQ